MHLTTKQVPSSMFTLKRTEPAPHAVVATPPKPVVHPALADPGFIREFAEIEVYGKRNERPPAARMYVIRIDRAKHTLDAAGLTGRQLLELAGKRPAERFAIFLGLSGGRTQVLPHDAVIDFMTIGLERLVTLPLDQTEGAK
jgi:hypothetical protein